MTQFSIDSTWSLFLDRDGVINQRIPGQYVQSITEFQFLPDVLKGLQQLSLIFHRIFVVTNQQGIGKKLMTVAELEQVHSFMLQELTRQGILIDKVYYCPDLANTGSACRKPAIGMALQAKEEFPDIDLGKSIIVGDSISDMAFGQNAGMKTVLVKGKTEEKEMRRAALEAGLRIDLEIERLTELVDALQGSF